MPEPRVAVRSWTRATDDEVRSGLLGYLGVDYGDLMLDGVTLRRTADGRLALSFPSRTDRKGRRHPFIRPVDEAARRTIERAILAQLAVADAKDEPS
ncbi:MAG: hypothetical protein JNK49_21640 [Planctomycetes bacterium]|nr:hypothetical protein [Planctomycetota bacterium]